MLGGHWLGIGWVASRVGGGGIASLRGGGDAGGGGSVGCTPHLPRPPDARAVLPLTSPVLSPPSPPRGGFGLGLADGKAHRALRGSTAVQVLQIRGILIFGLGVLNEK